MNNRATLETVPVNGAAAAWRGSRHGADPTAGERGGTARIRRRLCAWPPGLERLTQWRARLLSLALYGLGLAMPSMAATPPTPTELFDWAEATYPGWFPGRQPDLVLSPWVYRHYPSTGNYVGVQGDVVQVLGPISDQQMLTVGRLSDFTCQVFPKRCADPAADALAGRVAPALGYMLAVDPSGRVLTWGAYLFGATAETVPGLQAQTVAGVPKSLAVFANGVGGGFALTEDRRVYAWGFRQYDGTSAGTAPIEVKGLTDVKDLSACSASVGLLALKQDGSIWQWQGPAFAPWPLDGMTGFESLGEQADSNNRQCMTTAIRTDGTVWRVYGKPGDTGVAAWEQIVGLPAVRQVACGIGHCLAVSRAGEVWSWGANDWGQLGNGTAIGSTTPLLVTGLSGIRKVAAAANSSYAITNDGKVHRWGRHGILVRIGRITDTKVLQPEPVPGAPTDTVDIYGQVQASWGGLFMVRRNGGLVGWGTNTGGELISAPRQSYVDTPTTVGTINLGPAD